MGLVGQKGKVFGQVWFGQWIVGVIRFQKIFGMYGLKCHTYSGEKVDDKGNVKIGL